MSCGEASGPVAPHQGAAAPVLGMWWVWREQVWVGDCWVGSTDPCLVVTDTGEGPSAAHLCQEATVAPWRSVRRGWAPGLRAGERSVPLMAGLPEAPGWEGAERDLNPEPVPVVGGAGGAGFRAGDPGHLGRVSEPWLPSVKWGSELPCAHRRLEGLRRAGAGRGCRQHPATVGGPLGSPPGAGHSFGKLRCLGCPLCLSEPRSWEIGCLLPGVSVCSGSGWVAYKPQGPRAPGTGRSKGKAPTDLVSEGGRFLVLLRCPHMLGGKDPSGSPLLGRCFHS